MLNFVHEFSIAKSRGATKDFVHFFEGTALGFGYEEPDKEEGDETEASKEDVGTVGNVAQHGRSNLGNNEV